MRIGPSEQRLSRWATFAAAGSFMVPFLGLMLMIGAASATGGDYRIVGTKGFSIGALAVVGYGLSIYLLSSLPGKGPVRRMGSWAFSVTFHGLMLLLGATFLGLGRAVAIFMAPEVVAVALSVVGFIVGLRTSRNGEAAPNSSFLPTSQSGAAERSRWADRR
jgi:hypothetical protein